MAESTTDTQPTAELFPIDIEHRVNDVYEDFVFNQEKLTEFATDPEGVLALNTEDLSRINIAFDAKPRRLAAGIITDPNVPILGPLLNTRAGLAPDAMRIRVGARTKKKIRTPEEIESTLVHELRHAKQISHKEDSLRRGKAIMVSMYLGGALGVPAALEVISGGEDVNPGSLALSGLFGAVLGLIAGYKIAPHEREARKASKETPYMGIVTGTPAPHSKPRRFSLMRRTE